MQRRVEWLQHNVTCVVAIQLLICGLTSLPSAHARGLLRALPDSFHQAGASSFSLDNVAANLERLADSVPEEDYKEKLIKHAECSCDQQAEDPAAEEADANVNDEAFQIAPSWGSHNDVNLPPTYSVRLFQRSEHKRSLRNIIQADRQHASSKSSCGCKSKQLVTSSSNTRALSRSGASNELVVATSSTEANSAGTKGTGLWLNTCQYSQADLVFWKLTNTAWLPNGIVLKHTIAYTDSCDLCKYNNLACDKKDVELTDGNCLCMWRADGVDMQTELVPCGDCVQSCIGVYKTFDVGKPEPAMQKGLCLRKKDMNAFGDLTPLQ